MKLAKYIQIGKGTNFLVSFNGVIKMKVKELVKLIHDFGGKKEIG